jgi:hypothetical protein
MLKDHFINTYRNSLEYIINIIIKLKYFEGIYIILRIAIITAVVTQAES